ncbi:TonB-dependent receptor [Colwellia echini]|uniref:TonB-dependent receptor n=1 Tax=Colwellia echini TaxID=1982103 RepID=A0ABY3MYZ7_9GAMM|nr:TonB-dependent receptor [Colwellia echini]TYK66237.1 TonB-dependent receptor [Colwellia echini]
MNHNFKRSAISAAVLATLFATPIYAQDEQTDNKDIKENEQKVEVIEVTGFRGSLQKAVNNKRFSDSVSDSVFAEDVGKSTDQNIADALSRVTGVNIQEENGEGTRISVRGAGPSLNQISLNGVALTSGLSGDGSDPSASQSVDLSSFSSDILSSIDVIKTSSAEQEEGSLGASVVLRTVKPLSLGAPRRTVGLEGRYNDFSEEFDGRVNASFADKYFDDTFGFVLTVSQDNQKTREDRLNTDWNDSTISIADLDAPNGRTAHDLASGKAIRVLGEGQTTADLSSWDPDTQIAVNGPLNVLARNFTDISSSNNDRKRFSVSTGLEWEPGLDTNLQLDLTHTKQTIDTEYNNFRLNFAPLNGVSSNDPVTAWNGVNLETNTLDESYSRGSSGNFARNQGERELTTNVMSFTADHRFTDTFSMNFSTGYSGTEDKTIDFVGLTTATWNTTGQSLIDNMPADIIEPIGYNCTGTNGDCVYEMGETSAVIDPFDGSVTSATSRFNPYDLEANHLGGLTFRDNDQEDSNVQAKLDFTWDIEALDNISSVQFGVKYAKRVKDVHTQNQTINNGTTLIDRSDPNIDYATVGMGSIGIVDMLSGEQFPYDNFGEDLVSNRDAAFFAGWAMLDANKAIAEFSGKDPGTVGVNVNSLGTREIETETNAAYVQVNFEGFDSRLTGNIGLRYVKDKNTASGVGGINYYRNPHLLDPYDLLVTRALGNIEGSDYCPDPIAATNPDTGAPDTRYGATNADQLSGCWDWAITHGYDYTKDATTPYVNGQWVLPGGMSTNNLTNIDYTGPVPIINGLTPLPNQIMDINGNLVDVVGSNHRNFNQAGDVWQYLDLSTSWTGPNGNVDSSSRREAPSSGSNSVSLLLPSLNLNYAINEDMIGRFAVSKTMSRPQFDSLNPRMEINENIWGATAEGTAGNVNLEPLESNNLDLSYEWYFNESGLISAAFFYKDMTNFEESVTTPFQYKDVRSDYTLSNSDLLLDYDENRVPGDADNCSPQRYVGGTQSADWKVQCHTASIDIIKNGKGAEIKGLELTYTQNYDFLPGVWAGLGASFNYTYQQSEKETEEIGTTGIFTQPLPQAYTPEHSGNATIFYEYAGLSLRLANRYTGLQLVDDGLLGGAVWQESSNRLDFSSSYAINEIFSITFQVANLTDDTRRDFYTSYDTRNEDGAIVMNEGSAFDNGVTTDRTVSVYKTGRQFRFGVRATF